MLGWLRDRRHRRWLEEGLPEASRAWLRGLRVFRGLDASELQRLEGLTRIFLEEKHFEGCGGLEMSDKIRVVIAAQASLLILGLDYAWYQQVRSVLVYPSTFRNRMEWLDESGVVRSEDGANLGEAWPDGPVVLAWDAAYQGGRAEDDGFNTVLHEFAHKLDFLDDDSDGTPPLPAADRARWQQVLEREYELAERAADAGRRTFLDEYAATNPSELFAVAVESFFERPRRMRRALPEFYAVLAEFFRQDPASRRERANRD